MKGFQFDKTLSANFSSEQLTEINSRFFFHRRFFCIFESPPPLPISPRPFSIPSSLPPSASRFYLLSNWFDSILWIFFARFTSRRRILTRFTRRVRRGWRFVDPGGKPGLLFSSWSNSERCKFAEFAEISSRLNVFNGSSVGRERSRVINNLRATRKIEAGRAMSLWYGLFVSLVRNEGYNY